MMALLIFFSGDIAFCSEPQFQKLNMPTQEREYLYFESREGASTCQVFLIFLHGLQQCREGMFQGLEPLRQLANRKGIELIAPLGLKGSFRDDLPSFAWHPGDFDEHVSLIEAIISSLRSKNPDAKIILAGFSNGAFFLSDLIREREVLCDGFWLSCGGYRGEVKAPMHVNQKIVLEVGKEDHFHLEAVRFFRDDLITLGWELERTLFYHEHSGGHWMDLESFSEKMSFLISK